MEGKEEDKVLIIWCWKGMVKGSAITLWGLLSSITPKQSFYDLENGLCDDD